MSQGEIPSETVTKTSTAGLDTNPFTSSSSASTGDRNPFTGHASTSLDLPSTTQSSNSSATSASNASQYPDSIAQPGAASYGQGKIGESNY